MNSRVIQIEPGEPARTGEAVEPRRERSKTRPARIGRGLATRMLVSSSHRAIKPAGRPGHVRRLRMIVVVALVGVATLETASVAAARQPTGSLPVVQALDRVVGLAPVMVGVQPAGAAGPRHGVIEGLFDVGGYRLYLRCTGNGQSHRRDGRRG